MKIENPRTDIVTHKKYLKFQLLRLVKVNGEVELDLDGSKLGRGIYVLKDEKVIKKSKNSIEKALNVHIKDELIEEMLKQI